MQHSQLKTDAARWRKQGNRSFRCSDTANSFPVISTYVNILENIQFTHFQVDYWHIVPVSLADDAVEILESGGQEGPESSLHPNGLSLGEAHEVCTSDAPHGTGLRAVQSDQVELHGNKKLMFTFTTRLAGVLEECGSVSYSWP